MNKSYWVMPAFKFQNQVNVQKLLEQGNVYIPNMEIFSNKNSFSGSIYDEEGTLELVNTYDNANLPDEQICGLASKVKDKIFAESLVVKEKFKIRPENLYCFARYFFPDTLLFSVQENKSSCVFITDILKFHKIVNEKNRIARCLLLNDCRYVGRNIVEHNPDKTSFSHHFLNGINYRGALDNSKLPSGAIIRSREEYMYLIKPREYYRQYELRSIWARYDDSSDAINLYVPEIKELCIEVKFDEIYNAIKSGMSHDRLRADIKINYKNVHTQIVCRHTRPDSEITPEPVFNPSIRCDEKGKSQLYFRMQTSGLDILLSGLEIVGSMYGLDIGPFEMDGIESIEYTIAK
jgi:hypothetical protein